MNDAGWATVAEVIALTAMFWVPGVAGTLVGFFLGYAVGKKTKRKRLC